MNATGNIQITTGGTLANTLDFFTLTSGANPTNIQQTGGYVFSGRVVETTGNSDIYFTQGPGSCTYTISGGTLAVKTGGAYVIALNFANSSGTDTLNISGNGVVAAPVLWMNASSANTSGSATVNMQGGLLQADQICADGTIPGQFNFSGGTIQPQDAGSIAQNAAGGNGDFIGRPNTAKNITVNITGNGATYDTTDGTGGNDTEFIYAMLTGSGTLNVIGGGTLVFGTSQSGYNYSGQVNINSGTVRLNNALGSSFTPLFTSGNANVNGGTLDVFGSAATVGTATLTSGLITDSQGNGSLTAATFALQSGTVSAVLAGPSATLNKTTAGVVYVNNGNNSYGGLTTISAGTLALANGTGNLGTGNVTITPGGVLDTSSYSSPGPTLFTTAGILSAGRTSSPATDINGSVTLQNATISIPTGGTLTVAGNLSFGTASNGSDTYNYAPGDLINLTAGGAVAFSTTTSIQPTGPLSTGTYAALHLWRPGPQQYCRSADGQQFPVRDPPDLRFQRKRRSGNTHRFRRRSRQSPVEHRRQRQLGRGHEQELVQPRHQRFGFLL